MATKRKVAPEAAQNREGVAKPEPFVPVRPDPNNVNMGTQRGHAALARSVEKIGAMRSGVATKEGIMLAGNQTLDVMVEKGVPIRVIPTDGTEWIVIQRTDLSYDDPRAKGYAMDDNRIAELNLAWDSKQLAKMNEDHIDMTNWTDNELSIAIDEARQKEIVGTSGGNPWWDVAFKPDEASVNQYVKPSDPNAPPRTDAPADDNWMTPEEKQTGVCARCGGMIPGKAEEVEGEDANRVAQ